MMNAKTGEYASIADCVFKTARTGPMTFFKVRYSRCAHSLVHAQGYVPAFVRLAPQTVLTWLFLEQLRLNFGYFK
jgi:dicarboxylate transporter 10